jgi:hypothetical protein
MMPPDAPIDGLKMKDRRDGGRKKEAVKRVISESLDSWMQRIEGRKLSIAARTSSRLLRPPRPRTFQQAIKSLTNMRTIENNEQEQDKRSEAIKGGYRSNRKNRGYSS